MLDCTLASLVCWERARPCHICMGITPPSSTPGLGSPLPRLQRDWAHPFHICTATGLTPSTSAPRLGRQVSSRLLGELTGDEGEEMASAHSVDVDAATNEAKQTKKKCAPATYSCLRSVPYYEYQEYALL